MRVCGCSEKGAAYPAWVDNLIEILSLVGSVVLMLLLLWGAYRLSKFLAEKAMVTRSRARTINELDRFAVGPEQFISVVKAGSRVFLLGVTKGSISMLSELDADEPAFSLCDEPPDRGSESDEKNDFVSRLMEKIKKP